MLERLKEALLWSAWLGAKFFWAVPGATSAVVLATLVAQFSLLLAFFLPLKVIILLGSDGIPRYFPPALAAVDRDALILSLSVAAVGFYALYLLADRVVALGSERGASQLLARSRKMVLFEGQDEVASDAYKRYAGALAGGLFVFLVILVLAWLYPGVARLLLGYVGLVAAVLLVGQALSARFRELLEEHLATIITVLGAVGFMLSFVYLIVDFLYRDPPGLIPAIIALLLSRQAFGRLGALVPALTRLYGERARLDALFFHRRAFLPSAQESKESMAPLFMPERRMKWVPPVFEAMTGKPWPADGSIRWYELAAGDVFALLCETPEGTRHLVKVFGAKCSGQARHEATLLAKAPRVLPSPKWVGATEISGFQCHVLRLHPEAASVGGNQKDAMMAVRETLLRLQPNGALVARYARSRAFLWQRLDDSLLESLRVATDPHTENELQGLRTRLATWQAHLRRTPLVFHNPDLKHANLMVADATGGTLLHWGRWAIEPAGAGWPTAPKMLKTLQLAVEAAGDQYPALLEVNPARCSLAALTFQLEADLRRQSFENATKLLKPIRHYLDQLEQPLEQETGPGQG